MSVITLQETAVRAERRADRTSALERLERLCDPGSLRTIRSAVLSHRMGPKARAGDGVVAGRGLIDGQPVYCYAQDVSFAGGSLGAAHAETIARTLELARTARVPAISIIESGGARLQEGTAALDGYGRIFREHVLASGVIPQIAIVCGTAAGGGSYSSALNDFVLMTRESHMFLTGPGVVAEAMGEDVSAAELGGPEVHQRNGVCQLVAEDTADAIQLTRELLSYLPRSSEHEPLLTLRPAGAGADPGSWVPGEQRRVYDVRDVLRAIADDGQSLELSARWAKNIVTAFARIEGRAVGVIANQPRFIGGTIDADAAQKAARFVRTCNCLGIPLVVFVDTPGFLPGTKQESAGIIRHGAKLLYAFAEATVPKVTVVLRKAFGGAYITMNSRGLGADFAFAWPGAEIGVMAAVQAVGIIARREIAAAGSPTVRDQLADAYAEEHLSAHVAARDGFIDEVIEPETTRERLAWALMSLTKTRRHGIAGNIPL